MAMIALDVVVQGVTHKEHRIPCEDAAGSWVSLDGSRYVAVVADGHGDPTCMRSAIGAKLAVEVAVERLHSLPCNLSDSTKQQFEIVHVGREIVEEWTRRVRKDLEDYPVEAFELEGVDQRSISQWLHTSPAHLYGTTLVGIFVAPDVCVCVQQGDGCCVMVDADGRFTVPVLPDAQCMGPITTSLCDADAAERIRVCMVDLRGKTLAGVFVTSDGVANSYPSEEGLGAFFKSIVLAAQGRDRTSIQFALVEMLGKTSVNGSRDDASVAGIVQTDLLDDAVVEMRRSLQAYELQFEVQQARSKLISMKRKHDILKKRAKDGRVDQLEEYMRYHVKYMDWKARLQEARRELDLTLDDEQKTI
jgi:hypothetical protein